MRKRKAADVTNDDSNCSSGTTFNKLLKIKDEEKEVGCVEDLDAKIVHHNQPIIMSVFKDPETEEEKVIIVAVLPVGATKVCFSLVGSGPGPRLARIDYSWPPIGFEIEALFKDGIDDGKIASCHPKILALKEDLTYTRSHITETPRGAIELTLPIPVQTSAETIKRSGQCRKDNSQAVVVELKAYQSNYTIKPQDTEITFKKVEG